MKLNIKQPQQLLSKLIIFFKKYAVFIFIILGLSIFGFLVFQIRTLANKEPSESAINDKSGDTRPINIDQSAVEKVQQLQSANVEVKALFDQSRDNPFQE